MLTHIIHSVNMIEHKRSLCVYDNALSCTLLYYTKKFEYEISSKVSYGDGPLVSVNISITPAYERLSKYMDYYKIHNV